MSSPANFRHRQAIRDTWIRDIRKEDKTKYFFVIGENNLHPEKWQQIEEEKEKFKDVLYLPIADSYASLTRKVLEAFKRITDEYKFEFLFKCDDDTFVNFPPFLEATVKLRNEKLLYWGYFQGKGSIFPAGKWKETQWFLCDKYLPYAYGGGYVLSQPLVQFIAQNTDKLSLYRSEDVSVATWLAGVNMTRIHDIRFNTMYISRGCRDSYLVMHKQTPQHMIQLFKNLQDTGRLCQEEYDTLKPYLYNWNVLPSGCCKKPA